MTDELGPVMGVRPLLLQPRLFRTVVVSSENEFTVDIDTRGGRLEAVPLAGMPESAATGFLTLYGRAESQLRRALLRKITGRTDVSVGELFRRVRREHVPVVTVHRDNLDRLMDLDLPDHTRKRMRQQVVQRGWLLLAPTAPLETTSGPEFGWWSVAPQSGLLRGNLGTALSDIQLAGQSTGRPGRTVFAAVDILRRSANAVDQTLDSASAYDGLVCSGLEDTILVARSMCATTQLLSLPKTAECVATPDADDNGEGSGPAAIDLGARSCRSRAAKIRCGAAIAEAFLKGKLAAVRGGDEAKSRELNCLE
ncbi:MAG: hypothetical protein ABEL76_15225 [Bradymonadaceae bacterium]